MLKKISLIEFISTMENVRSHTSTKEWRRMYGKTLKRMLFNILVPFTFHLFSFFSSSRRFFRSLQYLPVLLWLSSSKQRTFLHSIHTYSGMQPTWSNQCLHHLACSWSDQKTHIVFLSVSLWYHCLWTPSVIKYHRMRQVLENQLCEVDHS